MLSGDAIWFSVLPSLPPATASHIPDVRTILNCVQFPENVTLSRVSFSLLLLFPVSKMSFPHLFTWQIPPLHLRLSSKVTSSLNPFHPLLGTANHLDVNPLWRIDTLFRQNLHFLVGKTWLGIPGYVSCLHLQSQEALWTTVWMVWLNDALTYGTLKWFSQAVRLNSSTGSK